MCKVLGVDIGGTKCAIILGEYKDNEILIIDKIVFPTETKKGLDFTLRNIILNIKTIMLRNKTLEDQIYSIGISSGGPLDSKNGIILSPPNLIGWDNINIVEILENEFKIKARLQNDANACALAEWKFGAAKGYKNIIFLTFGTGMGAGLILNGKLYSGTNDMAGEVGHIRLEKIGPVGYGKAGSFEGFCSGGGIAQLAKIKTLEKLQSGYKVSFCDSENMIEKLNAKIIADAADSGDELAKEIYSICGSYLGLGLSILIDILNPEIIVLGSIFNRSYNLIWPYCKKVILEESVSCSREICKVVPAGLGENVGDYASLAVALGDV